MKPKGATCDITVYKTPARDKFTFNAKDDLTQCYPYFFVSFHSREKPHYEFTIKKSSHRTKAEDPPKGECNNNIDSLGTSTKLARCVRDIVSWIKDKNPDKSTQATYSNS